MKSQKIFKNVEDVILNRRDDATERLLDFAENVRRCKSNEASRMAFGTIQERLTFLSKG
jgi:5-methyltetrahydrofolate--homocysteine methyltransferase